MVKYSSFILFIFFACNNASTAMKQTTDSMTEKDTSKLIAGNKDNHGCAISGGYCWSEAKKNCVRLFEIGIRLQPVNNTSEDASGGFLVFSDDKTEAELFIVDENKPFLLARSGNDGNYVWKKDSYELVAAKKGFAVNKNGKTIYRTE